MVVKETIKPCLREMFLEYLKFDSVFRKLFVEIEEKFDIIIFGGVVRDYITSKTFEPRDIDLVLYSNSPGMNDLETILYSYYPDNSIKKNQFEGYKLQSAYVLFDIWLLENTWAFKQGLIKASLDNLLQSVCLNIDAYAYHLTDMYFIRNCDEKGLPEKIDFLLKKNPFFNLNIIRALYLSKRYNIEISTQLRDAALNFFSSDKQANQEAMFLQKKHYNKIVLSKNDIANMLFDNERSHLK